MANHLVTVEILKRFIHIPKMFPPSSTDEMVNELKVIRIEIKDGKQFVVATNQKICAVEYVGVRNEPDDVVYLDVDRLENFIKNKTGNIFINSIPEIAVANVYIGDKEDYTIAKWFDKNATNDWRRWFSYEHNESKGCMSWELYQIELLFKSAPSAAVVFPEHINVDKPIVLRDSHDSNWAAVFLPKLNEHVEPATKPDWI